MEETRFSVYLIILFIFDSSAKDWGHDETIFSYTGHVLNCKIKSVIKMHKLIIKNSYATPG